MFLNLHHACYNGDETLVRLLLQKGKDVNGEDQHKNTPLFFAVMNDFKRIVHLLIQHGANVNAKNERNITPIYKAIEKENIPMIHLLLDYGADLRDPFEEKLLPIDRAILTGNIEIVNILRQRGAVFTPHLMGYGTPLHLAVRSGYDEMVRYILMQGDHLNSKDNNKRSPLLVASICGNRRIVDLLIKSRSDIDHIDRLGDSALSLAAYNGHIQIVDMLIKHGIDIHHKNYRSETALHMASKNGHLEIAKLLIELGLKVDEYNNEEESPLHLAICSGSMPLINFLLNFRPNINTPTKSQMTPLFLAVKMEDEKLVSTLLSLGANVKFRKMDGESVLHLAAEKDNVRIFKLLMQSGADIGTTTQKLNTPLHIAADFGSEEIVKLLLHAGANVRLINRDGSTPLHLAASKGHFQISKMLVDHCKDMLYINDSQIRTPVLKSLENAKSEELSNYLLDNMECDDLLWILSKPDVYEMNVFDYACRAGYISICQKLIDLGYDINHQNRFLGTGLWNACNYKQYEMVRWLLDHGACPRTKELIPLCRFIGGPARTSGDFNPKMDEVGVRLIEQTLKINSNDTSFVNTRYDGNYLLHGAAWDGAERMVERLIDLGANLEVVDGDKDTPLNIAIIRHHMNVIKILIDRGANLFHDRNKMNALHIAINAFLHTLNSYNFFKRIENFDEYNMTPEQFEIIDRDYKRNREIVLLIFEGCKERKSPQQFKEYLESLNKYYLDGLLDLADPSVSEWVTRTSSGIVISIPKTITDFISEWLKSIFPALIQYADQFRHNGINDKESLKLLTNQRLKDIGVYNIGYRSLIMVEVEKLR